jgi:hypothetical protein
MVRQANHERLNLALVNDFIPDNVCFSTYLIYHPPTARQVKQNPNNPILRSSR